MRIKLQELLVKNFKAIKDSVVFKFIAGVLAFFAVVIGFFQNIKFVEDYTPYFISSFFKEDFFSSDTTFNILILPFDNLIDDKKKKLDKLVYERFLTIDSPNIDVHFESNYPIEDITDISKEFNDKKIDLIIFGEYGELNNTELNVRWYLNSQLGMSISNKGETGNIPINRMADINGDLLYKKPDYLIHYSLAAMYLQRGMLSESLVLYNDSLIKNSKFKEITKNEKYLYYYVSVLHYLRGDRLDFLKSYSRALKIDNKFEEAIRLNAFFLAEIDSLQLALDESNKAILIDSNQQNTWSLKGIIQTKMGRNDEALNSYFKALSLDSNDYLTLYNIGIIYHKLYNFEKAIKYYNKSIALNSKLYHSWYNKGVALEDIREHRKAIRCFRQAIKIKQTKDAFNDLGVSQANLRLIKKSISSFKKALEIDSNDTWTLNNLGLSYYKIHELDSAIKYYEKLVSVDSVHIPALYKLSWINYQLGFYHLSISYADKVLEIDSNHKNSWLNKAEIAIIYKDTASSLKYFENANRVLD